MKKILQKGDLFSALFFIGFFIGFCTLWSHVFYYQDQSSLFVFDTHYLNEYLIVPGGIIKIAASFITSFFHFKYLGALIITLLALGISYLTKSIFKLKNHLFLVPALFIGLLHMYYMFDIYNTLSILIILITIKALSRYSHKNYKYGILAANVFLYYLAGPYMLIFALLFAILLIKQKQIILSLTLLLSGVLLPYITYQFLIDIPLIHAYLNYLPAFDNIQLIILLKYFLAAMLLLSILWGNLRKHNKYVTLAMALIIVGTVYKNHESTIATQIRLDEAIYNQNWNKAISLMEDDFQNNKLSIFNYNYALLKSNQLNQKFFDIPQTLGVDGMILKATQEKDIMIKNSELYYTLGYFNEAHRWAYESMVINGLTERALKIIVNTNLINGHNSRALKYVQILEKTLFTKEWAKKRRNLIETNSVASCPEYQSKIKLRTDEDYLYNNDRHDLYLKKLVEHPDNQDALEILMMYYLLENNLSDFYRYYQKSKHFKNNSKLPKVYEEALLVYHVILKDKNLNSPKLKRISKTTNTAFKQFAQKLSKVDNDITRRKKFLKKDFGNTYWYYLNVTNKKPIR